MYTEVQERVSLNASTAISQPLAVGGMNNVQVDAVVFGTESAGTLTVKVQESNDLENWSPVYTAISQPSVDPGYFRDESGTPGGSGTKISAAYVRLSSALTAGKCTMAAGINTSKQ